MSRFIGRYCIQLLWCLHGRVARPGVDGMANWFLDSGRAWNFGGTLNPGLPPGATGGRPSATGFRDASVGCDGWSGDCRVPVINQRAGARHARFRPPLFWRPRVVSRAMVVSPARMQVAGLIG